MMQPQQSCAPRLSTARLSQLEQLIDNSLTHDWHLCVEHSAGAGSLYSSWTRWQDTAFAVNRPEPVIDLITACHQTYPRHSIRLYAEKMQPRTSLIYWVYNAEEVVPVAAPAYRPAVTVANFNNRVASLTGGLRAARARVWKIVTVASMLLLSLLLLEEVAA